MRFEGLKDKDAEEEEEGLVIEEASFRIVCSVNDVDCKTHT